MYEAKVPISQLLLLISFANFEIDSGFMLGISPCKLIINLQGDMPNIKPNSISKLERLMRKNDCDIGTLASNIVDRNDITDTNVVKVEVDEMLRDDDFFKAKDFFRIKKDLNNEKIYHHI